MGKKLNKKDLLSTNLATKKGYCTQQRYMEQGLFELKKTTINQPDGNILVSITTKVTGRGQKYFVNKFLNSD